MQSNIEQIEQILMELGQEHEGLSLNHVYNVGDVDNTSPPESFSETRPLFRFAVAY